MKNRLVKFIFIFLVGLLTGIIINNFFFKGEYKNSKDDKLIYKEFLSDHAELSAILDLYYFEKEDSIQRKIFANNFIKKIKEIETKYENNSDLELVIWETTQSFEVRLENSGIHWTFYTDDYIDSINRLK